MNEFYKDAEKVDFSVYGILPKERQEMFRNEYLGWIKSANPLTEEIYKHPDYKGPKGGKIFSMVGGQYLKLVSGGKAQKALGDIIGKWHLAAQAYAREARKANGWKTGRHNDYLITPDGKTTSSNNQPIGKYAMPWSMDEAGDFDGTITDTTKFTA